MPIGPTTREPLQRRLGLAGLWLLVINGVIGAGIFGIPAEAERLAGAFSPWLFALCALLILPIMLCFARLSSLFSGTGGPLLYAQAAFGPFAGFQVGWAFYLARLTSCAANLNLLVVTIGYFWPGATGPFVRVGLMTALCALLGWVNIVGARAAVRSLGAITVLKLLPLVGLALVGLSKLDGAVFASAVRPPGMASLGPAVLLAIYAYVGFESGLVPAGEAKNPRRDLPRALMLALAVSAGVYALVQVAAQRLVPGLATVERPIVEAGVALAGKTGAAIVVAGIIASVGGNLLGSTFSGPRLTYRLALDGQLPRALARVHERHGTPWVSIAVYSVAMLALALAGNFAWMAALSVLVRLLIYIASILAMRRLGQSAEPSPDSLRLPGGPAVPIAAMIVCLGLLTQVSLESVAATAGLLAVGSGLWWVGRKSAQGRA